ACHVVKRLRNSNPPRQHRDIGDETNVAHQLIALGPGIAPQNSQFALKLCKAQNRVERSGLACSVWPNQSKNAALFYAQIHSVQRDCRSERLAQPACFYACHGVSAPRPNPVCLSAANRFWAQPPAVLPASAPTAESLRKRAATVRREISAARPA